MKRNSRNDSDNRIFEGDEIQRQRTRTKTSLFSQGDIKLQPSSVEEPPTAAIIGKIENAIDASEYPVENQEPNIIQVWSMADCCDIKLI